MAEETNVKITQVGDGTIAIGNLTLNFTTEEGTIVATHQISQLLERLGVSLVVPEEQKATPTVSPQASAVAEQIATQLEGAEQRFGGPVGDPDMYVRLGNIAYESKNYAEALNYYDKAIALKQDFPFAWTGRGTALCNLGRYQEALASFDQAIAINPTDAEYWYEYDKEIVLRLGAAWNNAAAWGNRGIALSRLGRYQEALASFDKAIAIAPTDAEYWNNRGLALWNLGRYQEALTSYDKAIAIDPTDAEYWYNRGNALDNLGRYQEAIGSCDRAIAIDPTDAEYWYNRGNALGRLGRYQEAVASYDRAIALKPDHASAWYNRGGVLGNLGRYQEAITSYDKAIALNPQHANAWGNRGNALRSLGREREAQESFRKADKLEKRQR